MVELPSFTVEPAFFLINNTDNRQNFFQITNSGAKLIDFSIRVKDVSFIDANGHYREIPVAVDNVRASLKIQTEQISLEAGESKKIWFSVGEGKPSSGGARTINAAIEVSTVSNSQVISKQIVVATSTNVLEQPNISIDTFQQSDLLRSIQQGQIVGIPIVMQLKNKGSNFEVVVRKLQIEDLFGQEIRIQTDVLAALPPDTVFRSDIVTSPNLPGIYKVKVSLLTNSHVEIVSKQATLISPLLYMLVASLIIVGFFGSFRFGHAQWKKRRK